MIRVNATFNVCAQIDRRDKYSFLIARIHIEVAVRGSVESANTFNDETRKKLGERENSSDRKIAQRKTLSLKSTKSCEIHLGLSGSIFPL